MIKTLLFVFFGTLTGILTGLVPGLHPNTFALFAISFSLEPEVAIPFLVSLAISHTFFSFVPSILLGIPDEHSFLSILPGHRMVLKGFAYEALLITCYAGFFAGILTSFLGILLMYLPFGYSLIESFIAPILILFLAFLVISSQRKKQAFIVVTLSAILGIIALKMPAKNIIFALVSGFFALPVIASSLLSENHALPSQKFEILSKTKHLTSSTILAIPSALFVALFPGISSASSAFIVSQFLTKDERNYLALIGGITTASLIFSLFVLLAFGKARTGIAIALSSFSINFYEIFIFCIVGVSLSTFFFTFLSKKFVRFISKTNYKTLNFIALFTILILMLYFCDVPAFLACFSAFSIATYASLQSVPKSYCMSFLIASCILYYI